MSNDRPAVLAGYGLTKRYGANTALRPTDFTLGTGEILAVLGENGAGKSTLIKILSGALRADEGEMYVLGRRCAFHSPREALQAGVVAIPQELHSLPHLTVAENICVGAWPKRRGIVSRRAMRDRARANLERLGVDIDPSALLGDLRPSDRQLVEIAKALSRNAKALLLDEPTAALSAQESERLFGVLRALTDEHVGLVYVSHRLAEVLRISQRVLVLRDGRTALQAPTTDVTSAQVVAAMLGTSQAAPEPSGAVARNPGTQDASYTFRVEACARRRLPRPVEVKVSPGEILGLFGLRGSGCEEVVSAMVGSTKANSGALTAAGRTRPLPRSPRHAMAAGIFYVPPERKTEGLILGATLERNLCLMALPRLSRLGFVRRSAERTLSEELLEVVHIKAVGLSQEVGQLSGGNQQKALVAARLACRPKLLIAHEPTRGVDVGARQELHELLRSLARNGSAVIALTSDVEEAVGLSDRLLVLRERTVVADLERPDLDQARVLELASGAIKAEGGVHV